MGKTLVRFKEWAACESTDVRNRQTDEIKLLDGDDKCNRGIVSTVSKSLHMHFSLLRPEFVMALRGFVTTVRL